MGNQDRGQEFNLYDGLKVFLGLLAATFVFATVMMVVVVAKHSSPRIDLPWEYGTVIVLALVSLAYAAGMVICAVVANRRREQLRMILGTCIAPADRPALTPIS